MRVPLALLFIALVASSSAAPQLDSRAMSKRLSQTLWDGYQQALQNFFYYFRSNYNCDDFSGLELLPVESLPPFELFKCDRVFNSTTPSSSSAAPSSTEAPESSFVPVTSVFAIPSESALPPVVNPSESAQPEPSSFFQSLFPSTSEEPAPSASASGSPSPVKAGPYNFGQCELSKNNAKFLWTIAENTNRQCGDNWAVPPGWKLVAVLNVTQDEFPDLAAQSATFGVVYSKGFSSDIQIPTSLAPGATSASEQPAQSSVEPIPSASGATPIILPSPAETVVAAQNEDAVLLYVFRDLQAINSFANGDGRDATLQSAPYIQGKVLQASLESYDYIRARVVGIAKAALALNGNAQIVMTAVSLGSPLAQLAAYDTSKSLGINSAKQMVCTTFGGIRGGDIDWANSFNNIVKGSIRVTNTEDIVVTLPPPIWEDQFTGDKTDTEHVQGLIVGFTNNTKDYYINHVDAYRHFINEDYPQLWDACMTSGQSSGTSSTAPPQPSTTVVESSAILLPSASPTDE